MDPRAGWAIGGALAILVPALIFGPWLPFCDLVAFVGMNNYPPASSTGPLQFSTIQFTYIVHYLLSRLLHDLSVPAAYQVVVIYLLQAGAFFYVTQALLRRFVAHGWICSMAIALGTLAFWDGMFVWGGPLPFSLGAVMLALATTLTLREIEGPVPAGAVLVSLLTILAMGCHPFAFPFCLVLLAIRFWFLPRRRVSTGVLLAFLFVFAFVIRRDSAERIPNPTLTLLFNFSVGQVGQRLVSLFRSDIFSIRDLFGEVPALLAVYYGLMAVIHLAGFVAAPVVVVLARGRPALRALALLVGIVGLMYFFAAENLLVTQWPQRILTFYSPFTFAGGIVLPWFLVERWSKPAAALVPARGWLRWAPALVLVLIAALQVPILRWGALIGENYARVRTALVTAGVSNAFIMVQDVETVRPYFLRCVPFLLFSDDEMVRRNNVLFTEWHVQPRHPTRLAEQWFDLGRTRLNASFSAEGERLAVKLSVQPDGISPVSSGNDILDRLYPMRIAGRQRGLGDQLFAAGALRDAVPHYEAALRSGGSRIDFALPLAIALARTGRPAEAIAHLRQVVAAQPAPAEALCTLGILLVQQGQTEEGIRHIMTAVELRPGVAQWHYELGMALLRARRVEEAAQQFQAALKADPKHEPARVELARLGT